MGNIELKWNKYIPHDPTPKQLEALIYEEYELMFGGALGGGKSDYLLMCALQYMDVPGYASACFRKSLTDMKLANALLNRCHEWLRPWVRNKSNPTGTVKYEPGEHTFYFETYLPDGTKGKDASLAFCYIGEANARDRYQSAEFQTICFDELSQWPTDDDYEFMTTRTRKTLCYIHGKKKDGKANYVDGCPVCSIVKSIIPRIRSATNPGGLGGLWIKQRWQLTPDPSIYADRREAIEALNQGIRVPFISQNPDCHFIQSYVDDNPYLDEDNYGKVLDRLSPERRSRLRDGNWEARQESRFDNRYLRRYHLDYERGSWTHDGFIRSFKEFDRIIITVDPAATEQEGVTDAFVETKARMPSFGVISTWGITKTNDLYFLHMDRKRDEIPDQVERILNNYQKCSTKPKYIKAEENGVGKGLVQFVARLGLPLKTHTKSRDKLENSTNAQLLMRQGKVYFPYDAEWVEDAEDEIFRWLGLKGEQDDIVDTFSDAANDIDPNYDMVDEDYREQETQLFFPSVQPLTPQLSMGSSMATTLQRRSNSLPSSSNFYHA